MRDNNPVGGAAANDAAGGLGPVVLEQKPKPLAADILLALALLFLVITVLIDFTADFHNGVVAGPLCGGIGIVFALGGAAYLFANAGKASYLHERGLRIADGRGERTLRYQDVAEMTFKAIRNFHNGAYVGTFQEIALRTAEPGAKPLVFRHTYKEKTGLVSGYTEGTPLNRLCNVLTGTIARRMAADLQRGESAPWTRSMQINNRGVEITDKKRGWEEVEWERIARVDVSAGIFRLWVEGEAKPRVQLPVAEPNFFPGYAVVAARLEAPAANSPARAPAAAVVPVIPEAGERDVIRLEYTPTVEDHDALTRQYPRTRPAGRKAWLGRVWALPALLIGVSVLIGGVNFFNKDIPWIYGMAAAFMAGGFLLRLLLGWLMPVLDRARLARELKAAHEAAKQGRATDPFIPREVVLGRQGYLLRTRNGELRQSWSGVSRVEWFKGYLFVFLAGGKVRREATGLLIPPRAFDDMRQAREAYETIQDSRANAARGAEQRRIL